MDGRALGYLGLARRGGMCAVGVDAARDAARRGKAKLVILAASASGNTLKRVRNMCGFYGIPLVEQPLDPLALGALVGAGAAGALAVTDKGLAEAIMMALSPGKAK